MFSIDILNDSYSEEEEEGEDEWLHISRLQLQYAQSLR